jgi:hypothetical protein
MQNEKSVREIFVARLGKEEKIKRAQSPCGYTSEARFA